MKNADLNKDNSLNATDNIAQLHKNIQEKIFARVNS